eukprot:UN05210
MDNQSLDDVTKYESNKVFDEASSIVSDTMDYEDDDDDDDDETTESAYSVSTMEFLTQAKKTPSEISNISRPLSIGDGSGAEQGSPP